MKEIVIQGNYCDLQFVRTRSVAKISIEIPIERAAEFVAAFGAPNPATECAVALARINPAKASEKPASEAPTQDNQPVQKIGRRFKELPMATQAGMRCAEASFQKFLEERYFKQWAATDAETGAECAAQVVRSLCGVESRSAIKTDTEAGARWLKLMLHFDLWMSVVDAA